MPYQFTSAEQAQIQAAQALCPQGLVATSTGNWVPFYTALSNILTQRIGDGSVVGTALQDMRNAKLWLDVAIGANGGTGMHSAFIRTYTNLQGEMRRGSAFSAGEMQTASNGVALNLWKNLSGLSPTALPWQVPPINKIAELDASSIGDNLFKLSLPSLDTAITANAAWSGAIGFNLLGGAAPYESWRLLTGGDGAANTGSTANKYDDFKNLLFAVHAYESALKAGYLQGGLDFVTYLATAIVTRGGSVIATSLPSVIAQINVQMSSGNYFGFVKDVAAVTPGISPIVQSIADMGVNKFLDMLMGAKDGTSKLGTTTDANFASTAKSFFSALTPAELGSLDATLLPGSPAAIASLAHTDVNARAALIAGSIVSVQVSTTVANSAALSLYNPATGVGTLTDTWLSDRALFVTALGTGKPDAAGQLWRSANLPTDRSFEFRYIDGNGAEKIILAENTARPGGINTNVPSQLVYFGGDGADPLAGSPNKLGDHLYGGAGADILNGLGGNDYLEGGTGFDTYQFDAGFGNDTVLDSDGLGTLQFDGVTLSAAQRIKGSSNIWQDATGLYVFAWQPGANSRGDLLIAKRTSTTDASLSGTVTVRNFANGELGLTLSSLEKTPNAGATGPINIYLTNPIDPGTVHFNTNVVVDIQINGVMSYTDLNPVDHWVWAKYDGGQTITLGDGNDYVDVGRYVGGPNGESWTAVPGEDEDVVSTGGGNDTIRTGYGSDTVSAGAGNDTIYSARVEVGQYHGAADALSGDVVDAGDGNDEVWGSMGADVLFVGTGSENTNSIADYSISTKATRQFDVEFKEFEDRRGRRADAPVLVARRPLTITTDARVKCSNAKTACARSIGHASQGKKV